MKKRTVMMICAAFVSLSATTPAFAGQWLSDANGWWWRNDDGSYPTASWQWLDGNGDGVAECYYFNEQGYCLLNTAAPDGYVVDSAGAWTVDGQVQTQQAQRPLHAQGVQQTQRTQKAQDSQKTQKTQETTVDPDRNTDTTAGQEETDQGKTDRGEVRLLSLTPVNKKGYGKFTAYKTTQDQLWAEGFYLNPGMPKHAYVEYYIGGTYDTLSFTYAPREGMGADHEAILCVYGDDDELLWESGEVNYKTASKNVSLDIKGQQYVRFSYVGGYYAGSKHGYLLIRDAIVR